MVYCGKPSTGCQSCRDKKTRCDRATPSCSQCLRADRKCPGYRNQLDLMFRNESQAVIVKSKQQNSTSKPKLKKVPIARYFAEVTPDEQLSSIIQPSTHGRSMQEMQMKLKRFAPDPAHVGTLFPHLVPACHLPPSIEECARSYFHANSSNWLRNFDLLAPLCAQTKTGNHLLTSMSAVGLAILSHTAHAPELLFQARKHYGSAIHLTNEALRSPTEAKKDSTLFAVLILSIFESITGTTPKSFADWEKHINGAAALIRIRGDKQFDTISGRRIFFQVLSRMMLNCLQRAIPMPKVMTESWLKAAHLMGREEHAWEVSESMIDLVNLRSKVRTGLLKDPRMIVEKALEVDRGFAEMDAGLTKEFKYQILYSNENPEEVWNGYYHEYETPWGALDLIRLRCCRILVNELIMDQVSVPPTAKTPNFTDVEVKTYTCSTKEVMLLCQDEVLASVPQHFAISSGRQASSSMEGGSRGYFMLWALYLIAVTKISTGLVRVWVTGRLRSLADDFGVSQAMVLVEHLELSKGYREWDEKPSIP
ncbi:hypothetical protein HYFRA_00002529 [Hymenoscyphus fraxineus]|uniref:Zn(2)-C6 fungal-type domain-containing protein n=1 Tax=Hymenoscyphus fraxineus TaxID=746836 RepID=A0A9N9LB42_9HELO|nr:hypothetical protein HYFRA_00002529 [Hymenoscyphus fraxineus]